MKIDKDGLMLVVIMLAGCFVLLQSMAVYQGFLSIGFAWWSAVIMFPVLIFGRDLAVFPAAILGYVGATHGWSWEWWQGLLLCVPFIGLTLGLYIGLTHSSLLLRVWILTRPQKF
jgi:hypothetical protein